MLAAPGPRGPAARLPLAPFERVCLAIGALVALGFLVHELRFPSAWDATQYFNMAQDIASRGLFAKVEGSEMRTYGYPWLASLVLRAATATGVPFAVLLFALQFAMYVGAAFLLRRALAPVSAIAARLAFCGLLVDFYALIYTPESLTESVSLTLLVLTAALWIVQWRNGLTTAAVIGGSLAAGFALMIRPANVFVSAAWIFGLALLWLRAPPARARRVALAAAALVAFVLPIAPQIGINAIHHGRMTPFVTADIGLLQQILGIRYLKYATGLPPVPEAQVPYENPWVAGTTLSEEAPLRWYLEHPLRGAATTALHTFNLTDQDLLFTYSRDLRPWYRIPLGIVNHAAVALGLIGLSVAARKVRHDRRAPDAFLVLACLIAANWAVYAWTAVEMRFGATLLLVLVPFAGYAMIDVARRGARVRRAVALGTGVYIVLALAVSSWVRDQSPLIRSAVQSVAASAAIV